MNRDTYKLEVRDVAASPLPTPYTPKVACINFDSGVVCWA